MAKKKISLKTKLAKLQAQLNYPSAAELKQDKIYEKAKKNGYFIPLDSIVEKCSGCPQRICLVPTHMGQYKAYETNAYGAPTIEHICSGSDPKSGSLKGALQGGGFETKRSKF